VEGLRRGKRLIYLLHLWQERSPQPGSPEVWRISLEGPHPGQRRGFADLEGLFSFLREQLGEGGPGSRGVGRGGFQRGKRQKSKRN